MARLLCLSAHLDSTRASPLCQMIRRWSCCSHQFWWIGRQSIGPRQEISRYVTSSQAMPSPELVLTASEPICRRGMIASVVSMSSSSQRSPATFNGKRPDVLAGVWLGRPSITKMRVQTLRQILSSLKGSDVRARWPHDGCCHWCRGRSV